MTAGVTIAGAPSRQRHRMARHDGVGIQHPQQFVVQVQIVHPPQALKLVAPFHQHAFGAVHRGQQQVGGLGVVAQPLGGGMEDQDQALHALDQRIMQLARDALAFAGAFADTLVDLFGNIADTGQIGGIKQPQHHRAAQRPEPPALIPCRADRKIKHQRRGRPHAVLIGHQQFKTIGARPQIAQQRSAAAPDRASDRIARARPHQPVTEAQPVGHGHAGGGEKNIHRHGARIQRHAGQGAISRPPARMARSTGRGTMRLECRRAGSIESTLRRVRNHTRPSPPCATCAPGAFCTKLFTRRENQRLRAPARRPPAQRARQIARGQPQDARIANAPACAVRPVDHRVERGGPGIVCGGQEGAVGQERGLQPRRR
jgi:hypothetical protein